MKGLKFVFILFLASHSLCAEDGTRFLIHAILSDGAISPVGKPEEVKSEYDLKQALFILNKDRSISPPMIFGSGGGAVSSVKEGVVFILERGPDNQSTIISEVSLPALKKIQGSEITIPYRLVFSRRIDGMWSPAMKNAIQPTANLLLVEGLFPSGSIKKADVIVAIDLESHKYSEIMTEAKDHYGLFFHLPETDTTGILFQEGTGYTFGNLKGNINNIQSTRFPVLLQKMLKMPHGWADFYYYLVHHDPSGDFLAMTDGNNKGIALKQFSLDPQKILSDNTEIPFPKITGIPALLSSDPMSPLIAMSVSNYKTSAEGYSIEDSTLILIDLTNKTITKTLEIEGLSALTCYKGVVYYAIGNQLMMLDPSKGNSVAVAHFPVRRVTEIIPLPEK